MKSDKRLKKGSLRKRERETAMHSERDLKQVRMRYLGKMRHIENARKQGLFGKV
jgi:hypothetical protein